MYWKLHEKRRYRRDQASSTEKVRLLWENLKDALRVTEHPTLHQVYTEVQYLLFEPESVDVTFEAWVGEARR